MATTMTALTEPPPDREAMEEVVNTMREALAVVGAAFDALGEQTARMAKMGPAMDTAHQVRVPIRRVECELTGFRRRRI